jgi:DNA-binding CsgD family transcriptional regulator
VSRPSPTPTELVNGLGDLVLILDRDQRVTAAYGRWIRARRVRATQFVGKRAAELWPAEVAAFHGAMHARGLEGQVVVYDWEDPMPGSGHRMMTVICPIYGGSPPAVTGLVRTAIELDAAVRPTALHAVQLALRGADRARPAEGGARGGRRAKASTEPGATPAARLHLSKRVQNLVFRLSPRERHIVALMLDSARPAQIARGLELSIHTVRQHLKHILKKADVHSQQELLELLRGGDGVR